MTLFDLTAEFQALLARLDDAEPGDDGAVAELERIEADIRNKADGYCSLIRHYQELAKACAHEAERLGDRACEFGAKAHWLKQRLHDALLRLGETKLQTPANTVTVCRNGGAEPVKVDVDPETLPDEYVYHEIKHKPDVDRIRADLKAGLHVPGCRLEERGTHLRLK
jgi:hypothetical protein